MIHHDQIDEETRAFVRSVARALARGDGHLADEVEQETLLAALTHRPRDPGAKRGWLRAIALNSLRSMKGREARGPRTVRWEEGQGVTARTSDPADLHMRDEVRALLDRRLGELTPAMRETIRLRVLEGLPPREVAGRLGVPTETVRTRTRRGLERLRETAERDLGLRPLEPRRPFLGLVPLLRRSWLVAAAGTVAAGLGVLVLWPAADDVDRPGSDGQRTASRVAEATAAVEPRPTDAARAAVTVGGAGNSAAAPRPSRAAARTIPGVIPLEVLVVGPEGDPVADAVIHVRRGVRGHVRRAGRTGTDGLADIEAIPAMRLVAAQGPAGWTSRAIVVDQPSILSSGRLTLALEPHPVAWIDVHGHGADAPDLEVRCVPADLGVLCRLDARAGGSGAALWLPAWRDAAGRRGVTWNDHAKSIVVERGGAAVWRTRVFGPFEPPPRAIDLEPTWSVAGRLVTQSGAGVDDVVVEFTPLRGSATSRRVESTEGGAFRLDAIVSEGVAVAVAGTKLREVLRPVSGPSERDIGDLLLAGSDGDDALALRVFEDQGGPAVRRIAGVEVRERDLWTAHGLLTNHTVLVEAVPDEDAAATRGVQALLVERPRASLSAVVVEFEDAALPPMLVVRPAGGWGVGGAEIAAAPAAPASITCAIAADAAPALARWKHRSSGLARSVRVEAAAGEELLAIESPSLCAGTWDLLLVDGRGRSFERTGIRVAAGGRSDLGRIDDPSDEAWATIDWSPAISAGAPGDRVVVEVRRAGRVILERAGPRSMLGTGGWIGRTFEAAPHDILVRSARGRLGWSTDARGRVAGDASAR